MGPDYDFGTSVVIRDIGGGKQILKKAETHKVEVILPMDHLVAFPMKDPELRSPTVVSTIPDSLDWML